jgi:hypothetical protein
MPGLLQRYYLRLLEMRLVLKIDSWGSLIRDRKSLSAEYDPAGPGFGTNVTSKTIRHYSTPGMARMLHP